MTDEQFRENERYGIALCQTIDTNTFSQLTAIKGLAYEDLAKELKESLTRQALGLFVRFKTIESGFNGVWTGEKETENVPAE